MTEPDLLAESAEELFEEAPCGYLTTRLDGTILRVNRTFETWLGQPREELLGRRFQDLLSVGGRIYHETHYAPLLRMQGVVREMAFELVRGDGSRLPALVNSVVRRDEDGRPRAVRTMVFDATDRRRYEEELLRARRREQDVAQHLQRSLLSGALPESPDAEVEVVYRPAVRGLEVGGDWYDAFWLREGETIALVVGDVVGRGIEAAAVMGQLRSAVRALASTDLRPGPLLDALDRYVHHHEVGEMATVVYAELDLRSAELRYACAGHPPPVIVVPGEPAGLGWDGRSLPVSAYMSAAAPREEGVRALAPGAAVLLYTDGLIERRWRPIGEGLDLLLREVEAHRDESATRLATGVAHAFHEAGHEDDVCVLAARLAG